MADKTPSLEASFECHADWVNDLALVHDLLLSCSNDKTVRVWKAGSQGVCYMHACITTQM